MAAMFLAMVWYAVRRQAAVEEAGRLAASEHRLLMGQREFVRDASHELRTPITVARGHAELIRDAGLGGQISKDAEVILDELGHLSRLSERLLILTTAGHPGFLSPGVVAVEPFLEGLMRRWAPTADRDWQIRIDAHGTVRVDRERLETALDGLLENAVNATSSGDAIRVACHADGARSPDRGRGRRARHPPPRISRGSSNASPAWRPTARGGTEARGSACRSRKRSWRRTAGRSRSRAGRGPGRRSGSASAGSAPSRTSTRHGASTPMSSRRPSGRTRLRGSETTAPPDRSPAPGGCVQCRRGR